MIGSKGSKQVFAKSGKCVKYLSLKVDMQQIAAWLKAMKMYNYFHLQPLYHCSISIYAKQEVLLGI